MPANGRRDLIRRLKLKILFVSIQQITSLKGKYFNQLFSDSPARYRSWTLCTYYSISGTFAVKTGTNTVNRFLNTNTSQTAQTHAASLSYSEHTNKKNAIIWNLIYCGAATAQSINWLATGFESRQEQEILILHKTTRPAVGPIHTAPAVPSTDTKSRGVLIMKAVKVYWGIRYRATLILQLNVMNFTLLPLYP